MQISVYVKPGSSRNRVGGSHDDRLVVAVTAAAVDGAANSAVVIALSDALNTPKRNIHIKSGLTGKRKIVEVDGDFQELISQLLKEH
ncbi:MAG: DUF167 domain-containing protein [Actinomycetes bacterium]|jgi:uncharacterized protein